MIEKLQPIPYKKTGYFTDLVCDYIDRKPEIQPFYTNFPDIQGFGDQIKRKQESYNHSFREVLVRQLNAQYGAIRVSELTRENIQKLSSEHTFTVTTGHQLNIFTGPLYFLYKIVSAIKLARTLKEHFPKHHFVPVYWMATEDHDFEEISFFDYKGQRFTWNSTQKGPVGRFNTAGLEAVFDEFSKALGKGKHAGELRKLFTDAYLKHENLAGATRFLANELFGESGLVIVDGDDRELKKCFVPQVTDELTKGLFSKEIEKTVRSLSKRYKIQIAPRAINLFYLKTGLRERIIFENGMYRVLNTGMVFSEKEILTELNEHPERFSPNALMRPLYQEVVLPNLCYIGGGAEVAYWMELKSAFEQNGVTLPVILLRNSALIMTQKQYGKLQKLEVDLEDIFLKKEAFINKKVREMSEISIDFSEQKKVIEAIFEQLEVISHCTDKSFIGAVKAQRKKQLNGLDMLEKRLLKAQKRKLNELVARISSIHHELFPGEKLQERVVNISEFYEIAGKALVSGLIKHLEPLRLEFDVLLIK